jgi:hypothetical protein
VAEDEDLQLLRATRPSEQPNEREQAPHDEIDERPDHAAPSLDQDPRAPNLASPTRRGAADAFPSPTRNGVRMISTALASEDLVEEVAELAVAIVDQEADRCQPFRD